MNEYRVTITETLQKTISVKAGSLQEAEGIVEARWRRSEYILDASCFTDVRFEAERIQKEKTHAR